MNRLTALSLTFSAASALTIIGASTADAHTGRLTAVTECRTDGWSVTWTANNIDPTHSMTPSTPGFAPSPIPGGSSGVLRLELPASQPSASISGYFTFSDRFTDPYSLTVTAPTGCQTPTTVVTTTTTVATTTTQPTVTSTTVATSVPPATTTTLMSPTTTTHPEYVTDDPQTLPATGVPTVGLIMVAGGLIGLGAWCRRWAKERS